MEKILHNSWPSLVHCLSKEQVGTLKFIGFLFMVIDHLGAFVFQDIIFLRILGRFAFPCFAYSLVIGFLHTSNLKRYIQRLFIFALVWQVPYTLMYLKGLMPVHEPLNFLFILPMGLIFLDAYSQNKRFLFFSIVSLNILLHEIGIPIPYGIYGLLFMLFVFLFHQNLQILFFSLIFLTFSSIFLNFCPWTQIFAILFMIFLAVPMNFYRGPAHFFYWAYPLHILFFVVYAQTKNLM